MDYFRETFPLIRDYFSTMMMEVQPMATEEYAELRTLGLDGVMVYQETYHESTYQRHHLKGKNRIFTGGCKPRIALVRPGSARSGSAR